MLPGDEQRVQRLETLIRQLQGKVRWGVGAPEGVVEAPPGTAYLRSDDWAGSSLYVKENGTGNTGWIAK